MNKGIAVLGIGLGIVGIIMLTRKKGDGIEGQVRNLIIDNYDDRVPAGNNVSMNISFEHKGPNEIMPLTVWLGSHKIWDDTLNPASSEDWHTVGTGIYAPTTNVPVGLYDLKVKVVDISLTIPNAVEIYSVGGGQVTQVIITAQKEDTNWRIDFNIAFTGELFWVGGYLYADETPVASVGVTLAGQSPYSGYVLVPKSAWQSPANIHLNLDGVPSNTILL